MHPPCGWWKIWVHSIPRLPPRPSRATPPPAPSPNGRETPAADDFPFGLIIRWCMRNPSVIGRMGERIAKANTASRMPLVQNVNGWWWCKKNVAPTPDVNGCLVQSEFPFGWRNGASNGAKRIPVRLVQWCKTISRSGGAMVQNDIPFGWCNGAKRFSTIRRFQVNLLERALHRESVHHAL